MELVFSCLGFPTALQWPVVFDTDLAPTATDTTLVFVFHILLPGLDIMIIIIIIKKKWREFLIQFIRKNLSVFSQYFLF